MVRAEMWVLRQWGRCRDTADLEEHRSDGDVEGGHEMEAGEFALHKKQHGRKEMETEQQGTC